MIPVHFVDTAPCQVTPDELLTLKTFDLVYYDDKRGEFHAPPLTKAATILRFLKAFGGKPS